LSVILTDAFRRLSLRRHQCPLSYTFFRFDSDDGIVTHVQKKPVKSSLLTTVCGKMSVATVVKILNHDLDVGPDVTVISKYTDVQVFWYGALYRLVMSY
jgi:hypothetical protein